MASLRKARREVVPLPWLTALVHLLSDILALGLSWIPALALRASTGGEIDPELYLRLLPALSVFPILYSAFGLYPALGLHPALELRQLSLATSLGSLLLATGAFLSKTGPLYSRFSFLVASLLTLVLVPLLRALVRHHLSSKPWWGGGVVVEGSGEDLELFLEKAKSLGLRPAPLGPWTYAVVVEKLDSALPAFPRVFVLKPTFDQGVLWAQVRDLGGVGVLEIRQNLLLPRNLKLKRALDLIGGVMLLFPFLLVLPLVAFLLYLEDKGSIFYRHERVGQGGKRFFLLKFRTMRQDGERLLSELLVKDPAARAEWETTQKLKDDPRILRIGRFLRRFSLDELPQALNILRGEMSLVGPRPVTEEELKRYGKEAELYLKVRPGLTGLWQVSGRNHLPYEKRVELDRYYVQNWSVWLDLYILARTVWSVVRRDGAW
ncbi:sugar transferase [Thermus sp. SYSU G05001]|uniref:Sugar transferase n=1 Tax=Thermus brevis TaxID=2862456 RepID=A0ABS6ZZ84_9DEIN|nr:sugar transferase [Thermus brevis]MBW6395364.1 sugar transferase [Thermus brevis]